jgi:DNA polymerase I
MVKLKGTLLTCSYYIKEEKPIIQLFLWTNKGKRIEVKDDDFQPYLLAEVKDFNGTKKEIEDLHKKESKNQHYVIRCEKIKKRIEFEDKELMKIVVNRPSSVPALKESIRKTKGVKDIHEYDIPFAFRYLLDKKLNPFEEYSLEVEEKDKEYFLKEIKQEGTPILPKGIGIDIETYVSNKDTIDPEKDPILMISLYGEEIKKVLIAKEGKKAQDWIEWCGSEKGMLERFFEIIKKEQPSMIFGYNSDSFDMSYIAKRIEALKIKKEDRLELREYFRMMPVVKIKGFPHIDLFRFIRMSGGRGLDLENYTLNEVASNLLGKKKIELNPLELSKTWDEDNTKQIKNYAEYNLKDSELTYEIAQRFLPSIRELTRLVCLPPEEISRMSFSQLVEWYLMRKASNENLLISDKPDNDVTKDRRKRKFEGAFVFQPTPGIYDKIVVFDFRSLYPSIIASHNISPETFRKDKHKKQDGYVVPEENEGWFIKKPAGLISNSIRDILKQRRNVKDELKKENLKQWEKDLLKAREQGLKTLANSVYGYLAYERARWYCYGCARAVASFARYFIKSVINKAQNKGFKVLYSDTDSIFITLDKKSKEDCKDFVKGINKELPEEMELEYEGYFKRGIFVFAKSGPKGAKKRYALIDENGEMTIKGFEIIRRNWSELGKKIQKDVLQIILDKGDVKEAVEHLQKEIKRIKQGDVDIKDLEIKTKITKKVNSYANISPHVAAAKRMIKKGESVRPGTIVSYIVGKPDNGKSKTISDRVLLPEECSKKDYDEEYYIQNQVIPAVESIFKTAGIDISELFKKGNKSQKSLLGYYDK